MKVVTMNQVPKQGAESPLFTGAVTRQDLLSGDMTKFFNVVIINFGKGVRNKFHTHTSDQVLLVTEGIGIVATEDEEITVTAGDVIHIPAGEKHWHGATKDTEFSHINLIKSDSQTEQLEL